MGSRGASSKDTKAGKKSDAAIVAGLRAKMLKGSKREPVTLALTADEEIEKALRTIRLSADYGYMAGEDLNDYRRIEALKEDLADARRLKVPDLAERTAEIVRGARAIAARWKGR